MSLSRLAVVAALPLLAACSGEAPIDIKDFGAAYLTALCDREIACCKGNSGTPVDASCNSWSFNYNTELPPGDDSSHTKYSGDAARACIDELGDQACGEVVAQTVPSSCRSVFVGTGATGVACMGSVDCVSGFCVGMLYDDNGTLSGPGKCTAQATLGASCDIDETSQGEPCVAAAFPSYDLVSSAFHCTCLAAQPIGAGCSLNADCMSGYCDFEGSVAGSGSCLAIPEESTVSAEVCANQFSIYFQATSSNP